MKRIIILFVLIYFTLGLNAQTGYGIVDFSANYMRESPDYTAELGNQSLMGTVVEILDRQGYWLKIKSPEPYVGWVNEMGVALVTKDEAESYLKSPKYICTAFNSKIFSKPKEGSETVSDLVMGDILRTWFDKKDNPVRKGKFLGVITPSGKTGYVRRKDLEAFDLWAAKSEATAGNIIRTAKMFLGTPYLWGGASSKGVDCSGLTRISWFMNGVLIPRDAGPQSRSGAEVNIFNKDGGLDLSALAPGDLLFFGKTTEDGKPARIDHVGIYIGGGRFIHSSQVVRISSLRAGDNDYYAKVPILARRYIGKDADEGLVDIKGSPFYFPQRALIIKK